MLNYDIPHDPESYVHRIGRTGRAGRSGTALLFVTPRERHLLNSIERVTRQKLVESQLPSVDDVNAQRVEKFRDSITEALDAPGIELFRKLIEGYERDNDVPMADIAAALAVQSRDGEEFLMTEPPPEKRRERADRPDPRRRGAAQAARACAATSPPTASPSASGTRSMPGAIVGAIANEGGLHRSDFGHISIRPEYSLVELPAKLSKETLKALGETRIQGHVDRPATRSRAEEAAPQIEMTVSRGIAALTLKADSSPSRRPNGWRRSPGSAAVAALLVVVTHAAYTTGKYTHGYVGLVQSRMEIGVPIFFVLSGFLLFRPWVKATVAGRDWPSVRRYAWHRVRRIMPAYAVTVLGGVRALSLPRGATESRPHLDRLSRNLSLTQIYTDHYMYSYMHQGLTQMWSLAVEAAFYVVLPLLAWLLLAVLCRRRWRPMLLARRPIGLDRGVARMVDLRAHRRRAARRSAPVAADISDLVRRRHAARGPRRDGCPLLRIRGATRRGGELLHRLDTDCGGACDVALCTRACVWKAVFYAVIATLMVAPVALGDRGWYARLLASRPMVFFGEISYEIFLIHLVTMEIVMVEILHVHVYTGSMPVLFVATLIVTVPLAKDVQIPVRAAYYPVRDELRRVQRTGRAKGAPGEDVAERAGDRPHLAACTRSSGFGRRLLGRYRLGLVHGAPPALHHQVREAKVVAEARIDLDVVRAAHRVDRAVAAGDRAERDSCSRSHGS